MSFLFGKEKTVKGKGQFLFWGVFLYSANILLNNNNRGSARAPTSPQSFYSGNRQGDQQFKEPREKNYG